MITDWRSQQALAYAIHQRKAVENYLQTNNKQMKTETYQQHITAEIRLTKAELSQVEIRAEKLKARIAYLQKLKAEAK